MEPTFAIDRFRARLGIVPVALHDARTPCEQLAVRRDSHLDVVEGHADRFRNVALQPIHGDHRRGLGHSVSLENRQPEPEEQPRNRGIERGSAEDREPHPSAQPRAHRSGDAIAQQSENDPVREARFAALGSPSRRHHPIEKPLFRRRFGEGLVDARGEFFEHARNREHDGRTLAREVLCELRDRAGVSDLRADRERQVVAAGALEHVRKRKQGEKYIVTPREAQTLAGGDVREDVAVREHHPLRPARSPRGVANRGKGAVFERRDVERARLLRQHRLDHVTAAARIGGEAQHARQRRGDGLQRVGHAAALRHEQAGAAVLQAPGDVFRVVVRVERHDDETEPERTLVGRDPVDAVFQAQRDAVAGCKALGAQKRLPARRIGGDFARGDISPAALVELAVENSLGRGEMRAEKTCDVCHGGAVLGSGPVNEARPIHHAESVVSLQAFFASCPRGLESLLAEELTRFGAKKTSLVPGGVAFEGEILACYRANLESRLATRVLIRLARSPYSGEEDVYEAALAVKWPEWFSETQSIRVDVNAIRSPLKSLEFATLRIKDAVCDRFRADRGRRPDVDTRSPEVRIQAFLEKAEITLYLDTSGEPLNKRGYRRDAGEAPLKENLAAGIVRLTGWNSGEPLLDPMCGSGTLVVEAAMMALAIPPGHARGFGFERLAGFDLRRWNEVRDTALACRRPKQRLPIFARDRYGEGLKKARL